MKNLQKNKINFKAKNLFTFKKSLTGASGFAGEGTTTVDPTTATTITVSTMITNFGK